jgi:archaellum component FlaC
MTPSNIDKILEEFGDLEDDFGFSAVSEEEYNKVISDTTETAENLKDRLEEIEKLVIPFLKKLHTTGDKEYIYWPNRKPIIEKQIEKILKLTRG